LHESVDSVTRRIGEVLRAHRVERGLSLGELSWRAGLSKSALARLESQGGNPSVETLWRLARALGLPLGSLLSEPPLPRVRLMRARAGDRISAEDGMGAWILHTEGRAHRAELFELELPAGLVHRSEPHLPRTEELVVCTAGVLRAGPQGEEQELAPGDAATFEADCAHTYAAVGDEVARGLNWVLYP
jgi:transcriptional regulator with XRE-family HTH domain